jgi:hypothetical protein
MSTDIYGFIEVRAPFADHDWYEGQPWLTCMDLCPLYFGSDYLAFGCLFGVRNWIGWQPIAAGRGLPTDVSAEGRRDYDTGVGTGAVHGATWIGWAELRDLDMTVQPAARGLLQVRDAPSSIRRYRVDDGWPHEVIDKYGVPPVGPSPVDVSAGRWTIGEVTFEYGPLTRFDVLGPGTGWEHVFEVMHALSGRFGDDGVRLVVWFD